MSDDHVDERDATIERLERTVADERQNSARLRKTIEELRFKVSVLEKGYGKQLADARSRSSAAERQLTEQQTRLAALDGDREETLRLLNETRAELERVTADPGRPRSPPARNGIRRAAAIAHGSDQTIDALMATASSPAELPPSGDQCAQARADHEPPAQEMLAPELVFPNGYEDDEES